MKTKRCFKLLISISFIIVLVMTNFESTYAKAITEDDDCVSDFSGYEKVESNTIESNSGNTVYEVKDLEKVAKERNIPMEKDGMELVAVAFSYTDPELSGSDNIDEFVPNMQDNYFNTLAATATKIKVTSSGETCGANPLRSSYYPQGKAKMTIKEGVKSTKTASVSVSAKIVSAGVGFEIGKSFSVSDSYSVTVPKGKIYNIVARPMFLAKNFKVLAGSVSIGTGVALKPIGVCFTLYK